MVEHERPFSPHLQVYRLPLNAILSISHRLTGVILFVGGVVVVAVLIAAAVGPQAYESVAAVAGHWAGRIVLLAFTLALYFHLCAGIRHLFWDAGYGYDPASARHGSHAVIIVALLLTVATWALAYGVNGG